MKIKDFEQLKCWLRAEPDYAFIEEIGKCPAEWQQLLENGMDMSPGKKREWIMHPDQENICTSFANSDVKKQKFVVRQKMHCKIPTHRHEYIEINYVAEGQVCVNIEGAEILMKKGDICIMDKNVRHSSKELGENDWVFNLIMTEEFFDTVFMYLLADDNYISNYIINSFYSEKKQRRYLICHLESGKFLDGLVEQIICEYYSEDGGSEGKIISCLVILFTELSRIMVNIDNDEMIEHKISEVSRELVEYLKEHYRDANLQTAAEYLHFHPNYLCNLLKKETGKTFKEYVTDIRMMEAGKLLQNTDWKIGQIAETVGYATEGYFYYQFKQKYQLPPKKYRQKYKKLKLQDKDL